jgi:hypothetical protein
LQCLAGAAVQLRLSAAPRGLIGAGHLAPFLLTETENRVFIPTRIVGIKPEWQNRK